MTDLPITWLDWVFGFIMLSCGLYVSYLVNFELGGWRCFFNELFNFEELNEKRIVEYEKSCEEEEGERSGSPSSSSP